MESAFEELKMRSLRRGRRDRIYLGGGKGIIPKFMDNRSNFPAYEKTRDIFNVPEKKLEHMKWYNKYKHENYQEIDFQKVNYLQWIKQELQTADRNLSHIIFRTNLPEMYKVWELR